MFEVGWSEMLVIAIVMIVVVGPKDLPNMLRTMGRMASKARGMANDFRRQFDDALKEAELDDIKKSVDQIRGMNPMNEVRKQVNPFEKAAADLRAGVENTMKPKPAPAPEVEAADAPAQAAEPLKNGAVDMPGEGPVANSTPAFPAMTDASAQPAAVVQDVSAKTPRTAARPAAKAAKTNSAKPAARAAAAAAKVTAPATKEKAPPGAKAGKSTSASKPAQPKSAAPKSAVPKSTASKGTAKPVSKTKADGKAPSKRAAR